MNDFDSTFTALQYAFTVLSGSTFGGISVLSWLLTIFVMGLIGAFVIGKKH